MAVESSYLPQMHCERHCAIPMPTFAQSAPQHHGQREFEGQGLDWGSLHMPYCVPVKSFDAGTVC